MGILDYTTRRLFEKFNMEMTYPDSLTSTVPLTVKIPMVLKNDQQAIQAAVKTCNSADKVRVRMEKPLLGKAVAGGHADAYSSNASGLITQIKGGN